MLVTGTRLPDGCDQVRVHADMESADGTIVASTMMPDSLRLGPGNLSGSIGSSPGWSGNTFLSGDMINDAADINAPLSAHRVRFWLTGTLDGDTHRTPLGTAGYAASGARNQQQVYALSGMEIEVLGGRFHEATPVGPRTGRWSVAQTVAEILHLAGTRLPVSISRGDYAAGPVAPAAVRTTFDERSTYSEAVIQTLAPFGLVGVFDRFGSFTIISPTPRPLPAGSMAFTVDDTMILDTAGRDFEGFLRNGAVISSDSTDPGVGSYTVTAWLGRDSVAAPFHVDVRDPTHSANVSSNVDQFELKGADVGDIIAAAESLRNSFVLPDMFTYNPTDYLRPVDLGSYGFVQSVSTGIAGSVCQARSVNWSWGEDGTNPETTVSVNKVPT